MNCCISTVVLLVLSAEFLVAATLLGYSGIDLRLRLADFLLFATPVWALMGFVQICRDDRRARKQARIKENNAA